MDAPSRAALGKLGLVFIMVFTTMVGTLGAIFGTFLGIGYLIYRSYSKRGSMFVVVQSLKAWKERTCAIIRFTE